MYYWYVLCMISNTVGKKFKVFLSLSLIQIPNDFMTIMTIILLFLSKKRKFKRIFLEIIKHAKDVHTLMDISLNILLI